MPVCVLGAAFKPGSDDVRDSPALDVAQILTGMGARVTVYDPAALENARRARPELRYAATLADAARGAHVVLLLTEWPEFTALTPGGLVGHRGQAQHHRRPQRARPGRYGARPAGSTGRWGWPRTRRRWRGWTPRCGRQAGPAPRVFGHTPTRTGPDALGSGK